MANLILPDEVTIQLFDTDGQPMQIENVLFSVHLFARHKNDFNLGPYVSDPTGKVVISNADLRNDIVATHDSGCMDYCAVEGAFPFVEIRLSHPDDIDRIINARTTTAWTSLLKGEKERWGTMDNLIQTYRNASNPELMVWKGFSKIRDEWDGKKTQYHYDLEYRKNNGSNQSTHSITASGGSE